MEEKAKSTSPDGIKPVDPQAVIKILKEPQTLAKINYILSQHGINASTPWLRLDIEATSDQQILELDHDDIMKLCGGFGQIEKVIIQPNLKTSALILFKDVVSAYIAQQTLHQLLISPYQARLFVKWFIPEEAGGTSLVEPTTMQSNLKQLFLNILCINLNRE